MSFGNRYTYAKVNDEDEEMQEVQLTEAPPMSEMLPQEPTPATESSPPSSASSENPPAPAAPAAPAEEAPVVVASTSIASSSVASSSTPIPMPQSHDSVFSNTVPQVDGPPKYEEDHLPTYNDVVEDANTRSIFARITLATSSSSEPDVFMGRRVGNGWVFMSSMIFSWFFGVLGFFCVYMMSQTHAGKTGSRAGLGLMFIQLGFYIRKYAYLGESLFEDETDTSTNEEDIDIDNVTIWLAYFSMFMGWFIFVRGLLDYVRIKQAARMISME